METNLPTHVRIEEPNLDDTKKLLEQILLPLVQQNARVRFLCPSGQGKAVAQRLRVMVSRRRKALLAKNKKPKRFRLHSTIHGETYNGSRFDCIVMWQAVNDTHIMTQELEDLLTND